MQGQPQRHPSGPALWACARCGRVAEDVPAVAISNVAGSVERRCCRTCIREIRRDDLTVVEELDVTVAA